MNHKTLNTVGVNLAIEELKDELYDYLTSSWGSEIEVYGRCYKNADESNMLKPEFYVGSAEYKEVYIDKSIPAMVIFLVEDRDDTSDDQMVFTSKVKVVCMMNLDLAYPDLEVRADEHSHKDMMEAITEVGYYKGATVNSIVRGLKNVFKGLDIEEIRFADIHPLHCFAVDIDLEYYLTDKCN